MNAVELLRERFFASDDVGERRFLLDVVCAVMAERLVARRHA